MENRVREHGEEKYGLGGAGGSPKGPWQWWPVEVVEENGPLRFFDDSTIW